VGKVAAGDLAANLDLKWFNNDELGKLAKGFGEMQGNLRNLVSEVSGSVVQLSSAAEEISAVARQSASNMNNQQHELNQLATAMNEMQATVQEVSRNTSDAASAATQVSSSAELGANTVNDSIKRIEQVAGAIESTAVVIRQLGDDSRKCAPWPNALRTPLPRSTPSSPSCSSGPSRLALPCSRARR